MNSVIICAHFDLAPALLEAAEKIGGDVSKCTAIPFYEGESLEDLSEKIKNVIERDLTKGLTPIIAVDLFGGTPYNAALFATSQIEKTEINIVTGINLPLLIDIIIKSSFSEENIDLEASVNEAKDTVRIINYKEIL